jgi:hypothetical protein
MERVIARVTLEKVRRWIAEYEGPPEKLKRHLVGKLQKYLDRADLILVDDLDEFF